MEFIPGPLYSPKRCEMLRTAKCEGLRNVVFKSTHVQKSFGDLSKLVSKPKSQISDLLPTFLAV
jgi:tyrosine-protein phosphatase YwqE